MDTVDDSNCSTVSGFQTIFSFETYTTSTLICSIIMISFCLLGVYGNVMSVLIFINPVMRRSSINILLTSLSAIDLSLLLLTVFVFVLPGLNETFKFHWFQRFYAFAILIFYPMIMTAQTSSVWTFVLITLERYLAVCYPLNVNKYLTPNRTKLAECAVVFLSVGYNVIRFWEYQDDAGDPVKLTYLLRSDEYYFKVYVTGLYLVTHYALPFVSITVLHVYIARGVASAQAERRRLTQWAGANTDPRHATEKTGRTTRMIFAVTCIFGGCNSLAFVMNIWEACQPDLFHTEWSVLAYMILDISNIAVLVNSSTSFIVYLVYCRKYKTYFKQYHMCLRAEPDYSDTSTLFRSSFRTVLTGRQKTSTVSLNKANFKKYYYVATNYQNSA